MSYPGVYRNELPHIVSGASPIENIFVTERYGINYECIETCYPILNICDDKCSVMPDLPECLQCQRLPAAQPTPIIIETPPYEPRPPSFEPIVHYPSRLPRPPMIPIVQRPNAHRPIIRPPTRPILPDIPRPLDFEMFVPPTPTQPPELEIFAPDLPLQPISPPVPEFELVEPESPPPIIVYDGFDTEIHRPTIPTVPHPPAFEAFQPKLPPITILPDIPRPPQLEIELPPHPIRFDVPQPILPKIPLSPELPPQPILHELLQYPQFETDFLPDNQIYSQIQLPEPGFLQTMYPFVALPHKFEEFEPEFTSVPLSEVPLITIFEPPQAPVIQPIFPEILNPSVVQIPNLVSTEQPILVTNYPENILYPETMVYIPEVQSNFDSEEAGLVADKDILQPPNEYQDICNDYCLLKRNISECEICLKTGVPADHLDLCSNCLVNPSEPDCDLCYPILLNLCREFCIFEENEPDCSICYPQPSIELPLILPNELVNIPAPILHPIMEYVPITPQEICPEYCVLTPTSPECEGCVIGVEMIEKVCIDICSGYCLENPNDEQCAVCYTADIIEPNEEITEEFPTLEEINYQCCYGDYCTPMPRNGICPVVCKELCTTACSNDCFNPRCPDCQEVVALNEHRRTQFMIWLKSKLSDMKSRYMAMIEACIRRTELMYERELQAIETEVDTSFLLA